MLLCLLIKDFAAKELFVCVDLQCIHSQDLDGNTALYVAVLTRHLQVLSLLMEAGADPTLVNFRIVTPILEAARIGFTA